METAIGKMYVVPGFTSSKTFAPSTFSAVIGEIIKTATRKSVKSKSQ